MYYVSYGCSFIAGPASFRTAWALQMIPAILLFFFLFLLPESPRWLASKGRWEDAHFVVANVNANGDLDDPLVLAELDEVREAVRIAEESSEISFFSLFSPHMRRRTVIGCSAQMWQQLVFPREVV
jgi:Sugar (and other) transporter